MNKVGTRLEKYCHVLHRTWIDFDQLRMIGGTNRMEQWSTYIINNEFGEEFKVTPMNEATRIIHISW